jgi:hypothetical protein
VSPELPDVAASANMLEEAEAVRVLLPGATEEGALFARDGCCSVASMVDEEASKDHGSSASLAAPAAAGLTRTQTTTLLAAGPALVPPSSVSESGRSRTGLRLPVGVDGSSSSSVSSAHSEAEALLQMEVSASTVDEDERGVGRAFVVILAAASAPLLVGRTMLIGLGVELCVVCPWMCCWP